MSNTVAWHGLATLVGGLVVCSAGGSSHGMLDWACVLHLFLYPWLFLHNYCGLRCREFLRVFRAFSALGSPVGKILGIISLCGLIVLRLLCGTLHVMDSKGLTDRDRKHVTSQSQTDDAAAAFWKKGCCSMQRESLCLVKINVVNTVRDI